MNITLATKFTIARIILIFPTIIFYIAGALQPWWSDAFMGLIITTGILFAAVCATDFIDGQIARKTNTVSDLGKFLDPVADKVVVVVMLFLIVYFGLGIEVYRGSGIVIAVLSAIILSRELLIGVFRSIAASKGCVLAADIYGKIKTICLDIGITTLIFAPFNEVIAWIGIIIFYIGAFFTVFSGCNYILKNKHVFKPVEKKEEN